MQVNDHQNNNIENFQSSFNIWANNAQKFNPPAVVAGIRRLAISSFKNNIKKLDVTQLPSGISNLTLVHAKNNYKGAFLVNTASLEQIIAQWNKNGVKGKEDLTKAAKYAAKNAAILLAMISSKKISKEDLCTFLKSAKVDVNKGWYTFGGNPTASCDAFSLCRGLTPTEFYKENNIVIENEDIKSSGKIADLVKPKPEKTETIFFPFYLSTFETKDKAKECIPFYQLNVTKLPSGKLDNSKVFEEISNSITLHIKTPKEYSSSKYIEVKVGKNASECCNIINEHSWYKIYQCSLGVEVKVASSDLIFKENTIYLNKDAVIEASDILSLAKNEFKNLNIRSDDYYILANAKELETMEFPSDKFSACVYQNEAMETMVAIVKGQQILDQYKLNDTLMDPTHKEYLNTLNFPTEKAEKLKLQTQRPYAANHIRFSTGAHLETQMYLINLSSKLDKLKELQLEKGRFDTETCHLLYQIVQDIQTFIKGQAIWYSTEGLERQIVDAVTYTLKSMKDETALTLFQGMMDPHSSLSRLPKELLIMIVQTQLALEEKSASKLLKDSIPLALLEGNGDCGSLLSCLPKELILEICRTILALQQQDNQK